MKKSFVTAIVSVIFFLIYTTATAQKSEEVCYNPNLIKDTTKKSIKSMAYALINGDSIKINYHSPGVRKRIIWGGLVPFDEVWVTGAYQPVNMLSSLFLEKRSGLLLLINTGNSTLHQSMMKRMIL